MVTTSCKPDSGLYYRGVSKVPISFTSLPKAELHLHLEGSIPVEALFELVRKHDRLNEAPTVEHVRKRYEFDDFTHFLKVYEWTVSFLKTAEDYEFVAYRVASGLARQNVLYAEIMVGLGVSVALGGHDAREILRAASRGFRAAEAEHGIRVRMQVATGRDHGVDFALERLSEVEPILADVDVCAFNMGGSEHVHPLPSFAPAFRRAQEMGLRVSVHAGEVSGPHDIRDALDLSPDRIGHGIRAALDPGLCETLIARDVPLEVCPISNECTGAVSRLADHPLPQLVAAGVPVVISSDDPAMFHTDINKEYAAAHDVLGVESASLVRIARNGFRYAFVDEETRAELLGAFDTGARRWCAERNVEFPAD